MAAYSDFSVPFYGVTLLTYSVLPNLYPTFVQLRHYRFPVHFLYTLGLLQTTSEKADKSRVVIGVSAKSRADF